MRREADPSVATDVALALRDTLDAHLNEKIARSHLKGLGYFFDPSREVHAPDCPAITIFDTGSETLWETIRGLDALGVVLDGYVMERFRMHIIVWAAHKARYDLKVRLDAYRDAIKAVLRDNWSLGGKAVNVVVKSDDPTIAIDEESAVLQAAEIRVDVDAYHEQGSVTL